MPQNSVTPRNASGTAVAGAPDFVVHGVTPIPAGWASLPPPEQMANLHAPRVPAAFAGRLSSRPGDVIVGRPGPVLKNANNRPRPRPANPRQTSAGGVMFWITET